MRDKPPTLPAHQNAHSKARRPVVRRNRGGSAGARDGLHKWPAVRRDVAATMFVQAAFALVALAASARADCAGNVGTQAVWAQCGGQGWTGGTTWCALSLLSLSSFSG